MEIVYQHVGGIDVHKRQVTVTARTPDLKEPDVRWQTTRKFGTFYGQLLEMARWLIVERGVTHVVMESTGVYWLPVYQALKEVGGTPVCVEVVNAAHVKAVPGRKTDVKDSQWLAQLMEVGLLRGSFIPPEDIWAIRDLTRYQTKLIEERTREKQRLLKVLETAGIKLDNVASDPFGVSGRDMLAALVAGERDPVVLAELARGRMRSRIEDLRLALAGRFSDHHARMVGLHLKRGDDIQKMITEVEGKIGHVSGGKQPAAGPISVFDAQAQLLMSIPGIGQRVATVIISEIGVDMTRFPTAAHLAAWAGLAPGNNESAGKRRRAGRRRGNTHLTAMLVEAAWAASRTSTRIGGRFHHLYRRFGGRRNKQAGKRAAFAVAHTLIKVIWKVLASGIPYQDLGADFYSTARQDPEAEARRLIARAEKLTGKKIILTEIEPQPA